MTDGRKRGVIISWEVKKHVEYFLLGDHGLFKERQTEIERQSDMNPELPPHQPIDSFELGKYFQGFSSSKGYLPCEALKKVFPDQEDNP